MIKLKDIKKSFIKNEVLKGINLSIKDGEFLVLLGPSGCGKTTCLRLIAGLDEPSEGNIFFDENDFTKEPPKNRNVSMVFQNYALFPDMNVYQNIAFGLQVRKEKKDIIKEKVNDIAKTLKIDHLLKRKPHELSGGEQQRVAIARAMVKNPRLYLFDEPLSNLDTNLKDDFIALIKEIHKKTKASFVYVTHSQLEALKLADRIAVMKDGKIIQIDDVHEIYNNPVNLFVANFIGEPKINVVKLENKCIFACFRPENIKLTANECVNPYNFKAKIVDKEFLGNGLLYTVKIENGSIIKVFTLVEINSEIVELFISKSHVLFFDEREERIDYNQAITI